MDVAKIGCLSLCDLSAEPPDCCTRQSIYHIRQVILCVCVIASAMIEGIILQINAN